MLLVELLIQMMSIAVILACNIVDENPSGYVVHVYEWLYDSLLSLGGTHHTTSPTGQYTSPFCMATNKF